MVPPVSGKSATAANGVRSTVTLMNVSVERNRIADLSAAVLAAAFVACGDGQSGDDAARASTPEESATPMAPVLRTPAPMDASPTTVGTASPSPTPAGSVAASLESSRYNANLVMWTIFAVPWHPPEASSLALSESRKYKEVPHLPVIIQMVRFVSSIDMVSEMVETPGELTGQPFGEELPNWGD